MKPRLTLALVLLSLSAASAAQTSTLPEWDKLTPQQRDALIAPVRDRWNDAPPPSPPSTAPTAWTRPPAPKWCA